MTDILNYIIPAIMMIVSFFAGWYSCKDYMTREAKHHEQRGI